MLRALGEWCDSVLFSKFICPISSTAYHLAGVSADLQKTFLSAVIVQKSKTSEKMAYLYMMQYIVIWPFSCPQLETSPGSSSCSLPSLLLRKSKPSDLCLCCSCYKEEHCVQRCAPWYLSRKDAKTKDLIRLLSNLEWKSEMPIPLGCCVVCSSYTAQLPFLFVCCSHCGCILSKLNTKHKHQQLEGRKIGHGTGQLVEIVPEKYPPEGILGCQSVELNGRSILEGYSGCSKHSVRVSNHQNSLLRCDGWVSGPVRTFLCPILFFGCLSVTPSRVSTVAEPGLQLISRGSSGCLEASGLSLPPCHSLGLSCGLLHQLSLSQRLCCHALASTTFHFILSK